MSRTADPKTLTDAYAALASDGLTVTQRGGLRTLARFLASAGAVAPSVPVAASAAPKVAKAKATGGKIVTDPEAPYGRKLDGTPMKKRGRKPAVVAAPEAPAKPAVVARPRRRKQETIEA